MAALVNLTVNSSTAQAQSDLDSYVSKSEEVRKEVEKFRESFDGKELDSFIDKTTRAAAAVTATDGPLKGMKTEQKALRKEIQTLISSGLDPQSDALAEITTRYDKVTAEVETLEAQEKKLKAESVKASKAAKAQATNTKDLATQQQAANTSFKNGIKHLVGMAAAYVSVQQAISFVSNATQDATDYLNAIAEVNTLIDVTDQEFQDLDKSLTAVSEQFAIQKTELTAGVYQALSAGAESLGDAMTIVKSSAVLATGALVSTSDAVDIVTTAINAYGSANLSAEEAVDSFFTIIDKGKIQGDELSQVIGTSISLFAQAKIPLDELGTGIATLTKVGIKGANATTYLNAVVSAFITPSEAMTKAVENAGYASGEALLNTEGLSGAIAFLDEKTNGSLDALGDLVPSIRGIKGAAGLSSNEMATFNDVVDAFNEKAGAGADAAEKITDGFAADAFTIEQAKIKFENFRIELGQNMLPVVASAITHADDLAYALLGLTAGLTAFLIVTKGAALVNILTTAFKGLTAAIAANPLGAIAVVITAVLVPALVYLYKNWDVVSIYIQTSLAIIKEKFSLVAIAFKSGWVIAVNAVKLAFIELLNFITGGFLTGISKVIEVATKLPFVGEKFDGILESINGVKTGMQAYTDAAEKDTANIIKNAANNTKAVKAQTDENIKNINAEADARRAALDATTADAPATSTATTTGGASTEPVITEALEKSLSERLSVLDNAHAAELETYESFYADRMEQENISGEERIQFLKDELASIQSLETLSEAEKLTAKEAAEMEITDIEKEQAQARIAAKQAEADAKRAILESELNSASTIMGAMQSILNDFAGDSVASVVLQKGLASTQAAINSYLAFTEVLKDPSFVGHPVTRGLAAGAVLASGLAAQASILSTDITAQTGTGLTGITIPDTGSAATDNVAVKASAGETVSVTPRNQNSSNQMHITVNIAKEPVIEIIRDAIDNNDLIISADNIQGAKFA